MVKSLKPSLVVPQANSRESDHTKSSSLACNACNTNFCNENDQKNHYKSEWHRYNLKCKIAGVPGVTKAVFLTRHTTLPKEKNKFTEPSKQYTCGPCGRGFGSSEAHAQHLNSQSHITRAIQDGHLNESKTIVKTLVPHTVTKLSQNEEKDKLSAPSKLYTCGPCCKRFGSSEAHAQHLNSQSHITRVIQDGHLNDSTTMVKTLAPHMVNKLSQNEEKNKLNASSDLRPLACGKGFGSSEGYAQHYKSQSHITGEIQDGQLNESTTTVKTLAPHMVNKLTQNEEKNKLNVPSKLYACDLCFKRFGSSEAHARHLNSESHMTRAIHDGHRKESKTIVKTVAPHMVNKLSQDEKNKLNASSDLWPLVCGKGLGSSEGQHFKSQSYITRAIQDGHLNESATVKTLAPDMVNTLSQNEKNKLNAPSKLYTCGLRGKKFGSSQGKKFGSSQAHVQQLNSPPHITRVIQDGHLKESKTTVNSPAPHTVIKLSQNEDEWEEVYESNEWEEVDGSDEWEEVDVSDEWEKVGE